MAAGVWRRGMGVLATACFGIVAAPAPAPAQFSQSYNFIDAVKDRDAAKAKQILDKPGSTAVNTLDGATGETALQMVTRARDLGWMAFLLQNGATPDVRDRNGNTALMTAVQIGYGEGAQLLLGQGANVNAQNSRGETPLILAVHNRDIGLARTLLEVGANPNQTDTASGMSARDYAQRDPRALPILRMIESIKTPPARSKVAGPH
jgi:ankyrin repeat protein